MFLKWNSALYPVIARRLLFPLFSAQTAHHYLLKFLSPVDNSDLLCRLATSLHKHVFEKDETLVGGVQLNFPLILAAGFVKGEGFASEAEAFRAIEVGRNIIPGWRAMPALVGPVEFGSFTRYPRMGNPGTVIWRHESTQSIQNRVGLRNPGAIPAAVFLAARREHLPSQFGINIALSPGVDSPEQQVTEIVESIAAFVSRRVIPDWFTLNISCPNTEDDPAGVQTERIASGLCNAVIHLLKTRQLDIPLWVKISPELAPEQYRILMRVFHQAGVRAVIATNTLPRPDPDNPEQLAGMGGGALRGKTLETIQYLQSEKTRLGSNIAIIACGGLMDGETYRRFLERGAQAAQYWSAIVYRGPMAAAIIQSEQRSNAQITGTNRQSVTTN